ncbi:zinc ABC transporter substrate-binding protein [Microbacterium sp. zg.Y625]|uniref:metal ABC transporter substrate-binding protein n=1 Tax=Microbacterium jiangjiandongii TaxID=3049071 RepID=UPI00214C437D|nr:MULTISPECIES: zinc ABC transporter substrate-binding protein [unclassified Microbacterium]MCR2793242.1 zinc ABC transporter substrate-binding protein [Microbacterium sp. zg.Y625]WIM25380.1 zinc ABC transporter substrate-binding protein [Microbacterium sp. zg-Y625]
MTNRTTLPAAALGAASVLLLAGCSGTTPDDAATDDDALQVVASTSVYGQIAEQIGGDAVDVTSIVSSASQDPHAYEASARDQLTIQRADLIIENGGGYDPFVDALIDASGADAPVVTAVEHAHDWPENAGHDDSADDATHEHEHGDHDHVEGFNEHVWYDPHTVEHVAEDIAAALSELRPDDAAMFEENLAAFSEQIAQLEAELAGLAAAHQGEGAFVTEPAPVYLAAAAGLVDLTPPAFSEAVEEGQDVPPATLLEALDVIASGDVAVLLTNAQTAGAETAEAVDAAEDVGVPVVEVTETLPGGATYIEWMQDNIRALATALDA